jgi:hypothetical protein
MKNVIITILVLAMIFTFVGCSKSSSSSSSSTTNTTTATTTTTEAAATTTTPSTGTVDSEYDPNKTVDFVQQTSDTNRVVTVGTIDSTKFETPVFITSFGQSTDAAMLETVMKNINKTTAVEYVYNATATADALKGYKTVIIAVGASTKGLGAAGISEAEETARATEIINYLKANPDVQVICCHIGGSARRGTLSDVYADMVMEISSLIVLKEDANFDYKFTTYAEEHNIPISLIYATKDTITVFKEIFK